MEVYSIGFTQKSAQQFFSALKEKGIQRLLDVRLNNSSQLAGFSKREDLQYFLREICDCAYVHEPLLAPTSDILDDYKKKKGKWDEYASRFLELMKARAVENQIEKTSFLVPTVLLCSEPTAEHCHRRLVLEYLKDAWGDLSIKHL